mgnify:CR=1 FL=1
MNHDTICAIATAAGEGGMLVTDDSAMYQRAMSYGHYERNNAKNIQLPELVPYHGLPLGGVKGRLNQVAAAIGRVQLKHYDTRIAEIDRAMNYFWDLLEGVPGIRAHRVDESTGSTMASNQFFKSTYLIGFLIIKTVD